MTHTHMNLSNLGNQTISSLQEAIGILDNAEHWRKENLSHITPFLSIIQGTVANSKYRLAQETIQTAETKLQEFYNISATLSIPEEMISDLKSITLPKEIKTKQFFETTLSSKEYTNIRNQITTAISSVRTIMNYK